MINKIILKIKSSKSMKAAIWFTIASIIQKLSSFITMPIFTRILTPEEYGLMSVYNSWMAFFLIISTFYFWAGVFNNGMVKFDQDRDNFVSSVQSLSTIIVAVVFLIYLVFHEQLNMLTGLPTFLMALMFVQIFFTPSLNYWMTRQRYELKYKSLVLVTLIMWVLNPLLGLLAIYIMKDNGIARILSIVFIQVIFGLYFYIKQMRKPTKKVVKKYWKYAFLFNLPLIPHYLSQIVLSQIDILMIDKMIDTASAGIYAVAYSIATISLFLVLSINGAFLPWTYEKLKALDYSHMGNNTNFLAIGMGSVMIILIFISPELVSLFVPIEYREAIWVIPPITLSVYFIFLYGLFANIEFFFEENKFISVASIMAAILNVVFNLLLIPLYGIVAAGYSTLICYVVYAIFHGVFMVKVLKKNNITAQIYNMKILWFISGLIAVIGLATMIVYNFIFIRYSILSVLLIGITIIGNKKVIGLRIK